ncbi:sulfatase family protein [Poritiphilus flavus]|uniref:Sulfatase-like hydrolase/transferase n=1 Tax=Poritiphilus flavus TaxID=2697053 RepID=A0A6L9E7X6_9FLAO|nr:arylsulfatase [Poritiphilus flavus]NAS10744.1 sulfatase-like hydrolase/transferase [Poritiphilus flavus]
MKVYLFLIGIAALLAVSVGSEKIQQRNRPNIIYVLADDLGYGDIAVFNENGKIPTPNLDRLASDGMIFTDAHTSSAVCTPTRYGILTGRYNWRSRLKSGVLTGKSKALIPSSRKTVAAVLKENKYATAFIGKWHLGWDWAQKKEGDFGGEGWNPEDFGNIDFSKQVKNGPNTLGFEYSYGHSGSLDMAPYVYVENGMPTQLPDRVTVDKNAYSWWREGPTASDFVHEDVTPNFFRRSFQYIRERSKDGKPFFLYLALPSPHTPILPTTEWQGKSGLNPYGDFVMMIDAYMGQLEKVIKEAGIEKNTLIIFTSDNGCSPEANFDVLKQKGHLPGYKYRGHKADIFEGGHRVPFIAKWPEVIQKGRVSDATICTTDLMASCAEIVGYSLAANEGEDSHSLLPLFKNELTDKPTREGTVHHSINGSFAIRKGDWKLIMCPGSGGWSFPKPSDTTALASLPKFQLYNLKEDPGEMNNLYETKTEKVGELRSLLVKYITEGRSTPGISQTNDPIDFIWEQTAFINP